jgi:hypothetical protein
MAFAAYPSHVFHEILFHIQVVISGIPTRHLRENAQVKEAMELWDKFVHFFVWAGSPRFHCQLLVKKQESSARMCHLCCNIRG